MYVPLARSPSTTSINQIILKIKTFKLRVIATLLYSASMFNQSINHTVAVQSITESDAWPA